VISFVYTTLNTKHRTVSVNQLQLQSQRTACWCCRLTLSRSTQHSVTAVIVSRCSVHCLTKVSIRTPCITCCHRTHSSYDYFRVTHRGTHILGKPVLDESVHCRCAADTIAWRCAQTVTGKAAVTMLILSSVTCDTAAKHRRLRNVNYSEHRNAGDVCCY
jgi:hypothetical protein